MSDIKPGKTKKELIQTLQDMHQYYQSHSSYFESLSSDEQTNPDPEDRDEVMMKMSPKYIVDGKDMRAKVLIGDRYVNPTDYEKERVLIAYRFSDERVVCPKCALNFDLVSLGSCAIYPVNIIPYSQTCHVCERAIVMGWDCQLHDNPLLRAD